MTVHAPTGQSPTAPDIKARHRAMWALGNYASVATEVIAPLGTALVDACRIGPGDRVLDVAAGSGNASIPAARAGAEVVASDLTPELLEIGRSTAEAEGLSIDWVTADAEALPFVDGEFDAVISCVGVMFAPNHGASASELLRVTRPGGRIGLVSWTPEGFIGQMFQAMSPYAPPPPPGAQPPPLWGREQHLLELFGDNVTDVAARVERLAVDRFENAEEFREFFKSRYGPTIAVYRAIASDPDRVRALDADLDALFARHDLGNGATEWEYLLFTARRS